MNPFRVEWEPAAEDELARIWLRSGDPQAVTTAQAQADQLLSRDPIQYGRHLSEGLYCIDVRGDNHRKQAHGNTRHLAELDRTVHMGKPRLGIGYESTGDGVDG